ncbi:MAG: asparaginase, partial [Nitriliruptoraceae bacterium]
SGRLESALLAAGTVAKVGAEGVYGVGFVAADGTPLGLVVKAADGAPRGVAAAVAGVLEQAGVVPAGTWSPPPPLGGGRPVGEVRVTEPVRSLATELAGRIGVTSPARARVTDPDALAWRGDGGADTVRWSSR